LKEAAERVLRLPAVSNKTFLITIHDRSITGLVARDQMVGPWQTPVADVAVTTTGFHSTTGEAMAIGERANIAVVNAAASARMAVGEAITNIAAANIGDLSNIKLSANWMAPCGEEGEDANLFDAVQAVGLELCPALGISIPVGKDSLSMRTKWSDSKGKEHRQVSPLSLVVTSFGPVQDVRKTLTPDLKTGITPEDTALLLIDLGQGKNRLGGASALARVYNQVGGNAPDLENPDLLKRFFAAIQELIATDLLLAYHDRSDGGLFATLAEMSIAGRLGIQAEIGALGENPLAILFNEELGAVLQIEDRKLSPAWEVLRKHGLEEIAYEIGTPTREQQFVIHCEGEMIYSEKVSALNRSWSEMTYLMQSLRDNPECAKEEYDNALDEANPGITYRLTYDPAESFIIGGTRPRMAILREQGVNGQIEMAAAFDRAGFDSIDVHMTDLLSGRTDLKDFAGLVACGGFSYGDVLGAGSGWAKSVLYNEKLREMFEAFFARPETFSLGVCNGCQMLSQLKGIIPGAEHWPAFTRNRSERFEARVVTLEMLDSPSVLFKDMAGSRIAIPVAHGEGFANFSITGCADKALICARYVDNTGAASERYPYNPNGSLGGATSFTTVDGRATIIMPHPERAFRSSQLSYAPDSIRIHDAGPWLRLFQNARNFIG
ncbi:TPA: phosphoribosylformylglycinamidine synthase, partial [Candidatus Sumerlaeota bacterium]|nr:phosphoribosylformylglycinamidine synthase [Candidatus Sumerlaeota bacterium]